MFEVFLSKTFSALSLFFIIILSIIVLKRNYQQLTNRIFFFLTLILNIWLFGSFMMFGSVDESSIIFWDRFIYVGIVFWPALQYHFSLAVTYFSKRRILLLYSAYATSLIFLSLVPSDNFVSGVFYYTWGMHSKAQIFHHFFILFFLIYFVLFLFTFLQKYYMEKNNLEKNRILFYILGFFILNLIGGSGFLPAYSISVFPISLTAPILFATIITYSIVYFNLMNIKLIMRRYFVYFLSFSTIIVPIYLTLFLIDYYHPHYTFIFSILIYSLALLVFSPVKRFYYKLSNRFFFSSLYDFNWLVYNLSLSLHSSFDVNKIFKSVIDILSEAFHSKAAAAICFDVKNKKILVLYKRDFKELKDTNFEININLLNNFFAKNKPQNVNKLKIKMRDRSCVFLDFLSKNKVDLILPIKTKTSESYHFLLFSQKESGETYNKRDLKVLELASFELGLALENIFLYQDVKKFNIKLKREIDKATAKLRKQNKSLMELDKMKDEFISVVSHQLRTPLTGIRWSTEMLIKNKDKNLNKNQLQLLNQINISNLSLIKLVNDLLDVSRIQLGRKYSIKKDDFNFYELVKEITEDNKFLIKSKKLKVNNRISKSLQIKADRDKIKQVLQNLLVNACKYSLEKGRVDVYSTKLKNKITFYIEDNGIGVPEKQRNYLFTKFFRAENASLQNTGGTGLGLYIAKEIVKSHKGKMEYKPAKNQGSIFYFELPIK